MQETTHDVFHKASIKAKSKADSIAEKRTTSRKRLQLIL